MLKRKPVRRLLFKIAEYAFMLSGMSAFRFCGVSRRVKAHKLMICINKEVSRINFARQAYCNRFHNLHHIIAWMVACRCLHNISRYKIISLVLVYCLIVLVLFNSRNWWVM